MAKKRAAKQIHKKTNQPAGEGNLPKKRSKRRIITVSGAFPEISPVAKTRTIRVLGELPVIGQRKARTIKVSGELSEKPRAKTRTIRVLEEPSESKPARPRSIKVSGDSPEDTRR